jgi:hypothetical protein
MIDSSIYLDSKGVDTTLWHHSLGHMSEKGMHILHKRICFQILKKLIWISVSIVFMENRRESYFSESEKKRRVKGWSLCIHMYGDQLIYHLLVDLIIMLLLLMMQLEKLGFVAFDKNLMFLILLRNGKIWLRMRQEKG